MFAKYSSPQRKHGTADGVMDRRTVSDRTLLIQNGNQVVANRETDPLIVFDRKVKIWMKVIVSLAVLALNMVIVISKDYSPAEKYWAYGMLGTILGLWLRM
jgi:hypothetical protein